MSKHDEQTIALVRSGLTVSAIKLLRDNTRCDLSVAKEMVDSSDYDHASWNAAPRFFGQRSNYLHCSQ